MAKRPFEIVVISDEQLRTVGCHAVELAQYLNSIKIGKGKLSLSKKSNTV